MVPLQDKIKEDKGIRIKDFNKDNVNHQSTLIGNQSWSSLIGVNWHPLKPNANSAHDNHHKASIPHPFTQMPSSFQIRLVTQTSHIC